MMQARAIPPRKRASVMEGSLASGYSRGNKRVLPVSSRTVCKVALANLVMWVRDRYFPTTYAHAMWPRLAPFFRLPGRVIWGPETVQVELRPFNDRQLNRDLTAFCAQVNKLQPHLPDGRH